MKVLTICTLGYVDIAIGIVSSCITLNQLICIFRTVTFKHIKKQHYFSLETYFKLWNFKLKILMHLIFNC